MNELIKLPGNSFPEVFYRRCKANPSHEVFAHVVDGKYISTTAAEACGLMLQIASGLKALGFQRGDKICIFAENREEWAMSDYAAQLMGGATTAIYTTSAIDDVEHILKSSGAKVLFVSNRDMLQRLGPLDQLPSVEYIVAWDYIEPAAAKAERVKFLEKQEFLQEPLSNAECEELFKKIQPEDMCILLYTSGTTGEPKGVVLSQRAAMMNMRQILSSMPLSDMKRTMSFLPLSHIYERALHSAMLFAGVKVYFAESIAQLPENMIQAQPEIMIGVPRIFEKMYVKIQEKLRNAPAHKKLIAKFALDIGQQTIPYRLKNQKLPLKLQALQTVADTLVFNKIKAITGGHLKYFISGGAPLSAEIARFFFQTGIDILEGYGMSETMILGYNRPGEIEFGTVGRALPLTEYKIAEDGEILHRGPQLMDGYFNDAQATQEAFTEDGWFRSGDIGSLDEKGVLRITDRKKEIIITAGGKNVAPQPIENALKKDPLIEQVCVVGDRRKYLTVLLVPNLELCQSWGATKGLRLATRKDCAQSEALRMHYQKVIDELNKDLARYESIKYFEIVPDMFSVDGGELTPTLKLKRRVIDEKYTQLIESMYEDETDKAHEA